MKFQILMLAIFNGVLGFFSAIYLLNSFSFKFKKVLFRSLIFESGHWPKIGLEMENKFFFFIPFRTKSLYAWTILCGGVLLLTGLVNTFWFMGFLSIFLSVWILIFRAEVQKKQKFISQLPNTIGVWVSSLKAGYSLTSALAVVRREAVLPSSAVFGALMRAEVYGLTLSMTARNLQKKLKVPEWELLVSALEVYERVGGNIIPILENVIKTLEENQTFREEIKTNTATGKMSAVVISLLAPAAWIILQIFSPEYLRILYTTVTGRNLLILAVFLELTGLLIIWRLIKIRL